MGFVEMGFVEKEVIVERIIGENYIGKVSRYSSKDFFTVNDGDKVDVYENLGSSKKDIKTAIYLAFIDPWDDQEEPKKVAGRYPNYRIEEVN